VAKGDPLFEMYSPEVVQAQDEYLRTRANLESSSGEDRARWKSLLEQARAKLRRWDVPDDEIQALEERGTSKKVLTWRSPLDGIVVHKNALEGSFFKPGQPLYRIADLRTVWVIVSIYEFEFPWVKVGQQARMELPYFPGETFTGKVDYIYPYLDPKTRDRKVRLTFENPGLELVPDMYATVHIDAALGKDAVLVPSEAVLDTGERHVVFVAKGKGTFDPRDVRVGVEARGNLLEVLSGLEPGETVVTSGQFLLDSESRIRASIQKMLAARKSKDEMPGMKPDEREPEETPDGFDAPEGLIPIVPEVCPVMGGEPDPAVHADYRGYRFFFCCTGCPTRFLADPDKYIQKLRRMGYEIHLRDEGSDK
jgi:Cu(I)/Ag(I) efflux system membrane fusion protein/cobalt-zinc-cadmium efflux system membrane fusion protein